MQCHRVAAKHRKNSAPGVGLGSFGVTVVSPWFLHGAPEAIPLEVEIVMATRKRFCRSRREQTGKPLFPRCSQVVWPLPYELIWQMHIVSFPYQSYGNYDHKLLGLCHMNPYGKGTSFPSHMNHRARGGEHLLLEGCHMNSYGNGRQADHIAAARPQRAEIQAFMRTSNDMLILLRGVYGERDIDIYTYGLPCV